MEPEVFKTYEDGYIVRSMTPSDAQIVQKWYIGMGTVSRYDLEVALRIFPRGRGFYIGEYEGTVVASCVRIPWGDGAYFGSYYYVHDDYRGRGFGTRMRDQVAYGHVLEANGRLCIDAVEGSVAEKNVAKFGYVNAFLTRRYYREAKHFGIEYNGQIVPANSVPFDELISFDNKHFVSEDYPPRKEFLREWIDLPESAAVVALDDRRRIVAFGQRHPAALCQPNSHLIGPLYGDDVQSAMAVLQHLCLDVIGDRISIHIWMPNKEGVEAVEGLGFQKEFDLFRMHANGNPNEYKPTVYSVSALDVCGF
ncbi:hypothetical protein LSH36_427g03066 [Paralvinella palmiformis]|uniref:N-acetyltransferase domain-containing protein n=1 Tax=Paralvinella palmiformis TaxID=53620 RepID=A0AAD9JBY1_9ANNE|nr:hypothetical protein LSH36_427g03066 [Paralvinella palmiformis]